jgi:hypothetical protein
VDEDSPEASGLVLVVDALAVWLLLDIPSLAICAEIGEIGTAETYSVP